MLLPHDLLRRTALSALAILPSPDPVSLPTAIRAQPICPPLATCQVLFQGLSDNFEGHVWWYDQFRTSTVEIALRSLRRMPIIDRSDAALVARHLTYAVGADICYGKWGEGDYRRGRPSGGYQCSTSSSKCYDKSSAAIFFGRDFHSWEANCCVEPDAWRGSTSLLALHRRIGYRPVQYCQCFVYAAIITTLGRALGVPTRPVTAFQSAHDTDANRAIDKFFDADWNPLSGMTSDSIWSFHVWAEMYFARPELEHVPGASTAGWQVVDATPQETTLGGSGLPSLTEPVYQMGPASLALVKANADPDCATVLATGGRDASTKRPDCCERPPHPTPPIPLPVTAYDQP